MKSLIEATLIALLMIIYTLGGLYFIGWMDYMIKGH